jgi:hypothetical protein
MQVESRVAASKLLRLSTGLFSAVLAGSLATNAAGQTLIGIDFNSATSQNEIRTVNPLNGQTKLLNSFTFDSGGWVSETLVVNSAVGRFYAESSAPTLYTFDLASGQISSTVALDTLMEAMALDTHGRLIGIDYNSVTSQNEIRTVNPLNGQTKLLNSFTFDSGGWVSETLVVNSAVGKFFAESSAPTLYTFDLASGQISSTVALDTLMEALALDTHGRLIGIDFNSATSQNEIRTVNPLSGQTKLLNSFTFDSGGWVSETLVVNSAVGKFFAESSAPTLYTFDLTSGQILSMAPVDTFMEALALDN